MSILIITFQRPLSLVRLLGSLERISLDSADQPAVEVVVVDNDAEGSGVEATRQAMSGGYRWPLRAVVEPRPGISEARNRALAEADRPDLVAFVDDDEHVSEDWLKELLMVQRATDADAVGGPVLPEFSDDAPEWMVRGGFFDRRRHPDRSRVAFIATNNVLIRMDALRPFTPEVFDPAFSLIGGGDTHLALRLRRAGARFYWADRAEVWETVPATRTTSSWLLRRWFRLGSCLAAAEQAVEPGWWQAAKRGGKGLGRVVLGIVVMIPFLVRGRVGIFRRLRTIVFGAGMVAGILGIRYREYARTGQGLVPHLDKQAAHPHAHTSSDDPW